MLTARAMPEARHGIRGAHGFRRGHRRAHMVDIAPEQCTSETLKNEEIYRYGVHAPAFCVN